MVESIIFSLLQGTVSKQGTWLSNFTLLSLKETKECDWREIQPSPWILNDSVALDCCFSQSLAWLMLVVSKKLFCCILRETNSSLTKSSWKKMASSLSCVPLQSLSLWMFLFSPTLLPLVLIFSVPVVKSLFTWSFKGHQQETFNITRTTPVKDAAKGAPSRVSGEKAIPWHRTMYCTFCNQSCFILYI